VDVMKTKNSLGIIGWGCALLNDIKLVFAEELFE
jgi:hypothetical protein